MHHRHASVSWPFLVRTAALLACAFVPSFALAQPFPPTPVVVSSIVKEKIRSGQTYSATVMPSKRATVGSAVDGRVVEFPVNAGDRVGGASALLVIGFVVVEFPLNAGNYVGDEATLAQLLTETIDLEIQSAEAELTLQQEMLAELENGSRPEEVEEARARMEAAKAAQDYAVAQHKRVLKAYETSGAATKEELDAAQSAMFNARETYKQYTAAHKLVKDGPRKEKIAQAKAQVDMQDAVVRRLKDQLVKHTIVSRFPGYVVAEHTEVGQWVKAGDPVAEVIALDEVHVTANVLEAHIPHVKNGAEVRVEIAAVPDRVFTGHVAYVVPQGDLRARTFPVVVSVRNEISEDGPLIKSGMIARVALATGAQHEALLAPKDAVVLGGQTPLVFVVSQDPEKPAVSVVRPVPVELGVASEGRIEVTGELRDGDVVVVRGNERLRPGAVVQVVENVRQENASKEVEREPQPTGGASSP